MVAGDGPVGSVITMNHIAPIFARNAPSNELDTVAMILVLCEPPTNR